MTRTPTSGPKFPKLTPKSGPLQAVAGSLELQLGSSEA